MICLFAFSDCECLSVWATSFKVVDIKTLCGMVIRLSVGLRLTGILGYKMRVFSKEWTISTKGEFV